MIDLFALMLIHGLLALMALRLLGRDDLDEDPALEDEAGPPAAAPPPAAPDAPRARKQGRRA